MSDISRRNIIKHFLDWQLSKKLYALFGNTYSSAEGCRFLPTTIT